MPGRAWAFVALIGFLLAACSSGTASAPAPTTAPGGAPAAAPAATQAPKRGGTLVIGTTGDPGSLNPGLTTASGTHLVTGNIYSGLLQFDENLEPKPNLADSWQVSADGKSYTFRLHPNVEWHDGKPFTSADVKFSFEEVLLKFHSRTKAGLENTLAGI